MGALAAPLLLPMFNADASPEPCGAAPSFTPDPTWLKALPSGYKLGDIGGLTIDSRDHLWISNRLGVGKGGGIGMGAPVIEIDANGNFVQGWGGKGAGYSWPSEMHGITVDSEDNVWITGSGGYTGTELDTPGSDLGVKRDDMLLKFTRAGKFVAQIGGEAPWQGSQNTTFLGGATATAVDTVAREVYVADGYGNHRVIVFDMDTLKFKRMWGAFDHIPDDSDHSEADQFGTPLHDIKISEDGLIYAADRTNGRAQVFTKQGAYVREYTIPAGSYPNACGEVNFVNPEQEFLVFVDGFVAENGNDRIVILCRSTGAVAGEFGGPGIGADRFASLHAFAADSQGNLFTGEIGGAGVKRFARTPPATATSPPAATASGCPAASGRLAGSTLGPIRLGMTRTAARHAFAGHTSHGRHWMDYFCLEGTGIRVGYPSPTLLARYGRNIRANAAGRVVLVLTANPYYSLHGVKPGDPLKSARSMRLVGPVQIGANDWYLTTSGTAAGVLKVRDGKVDEVGLALSDLVPDLRTAHRFLASLSS